MSIGTLRRGVVDAVGGAVAAVVLWWGRRGVLAAVGAAVAACDFGWVRRGAVGAVGAPSLFGILLGAPWARGRLGCAVALKTQTIHNLIYLPIILNLHIVARAIIP